MAKAKKKATKKSKAFEGKVEAKVNGVPVDAKKFSIPEWRPSFDRVFDFMFAPPKPVLGAIESPGTFLTVAREALSALRACSPKPGNIAAPLFVAIDEALNGAMQKWKRIAEQHYREEQHDQTMVTTFKLAPTP